MTTRINLVKFSDVRTTRRISDMYAMSCDLGYANLPEWTYTIYDDIPSLYGVYVTDHAGVLIGRTLVWTRVQEIGDSRTFCAFSRIYAMNDRVKGIIREWCREQGAVCLETLMGPSLCMREDAPRLKVDMTFPAEFGMYNAVPWIDYFHFAVEGDSYLYTHFPEWVEREEHVALLHSCEGEGGFLTGHTKENICAWCGQRFEPGDVIYYTPDGDAGCIFCIESMVAK